MDSIIFLGTAGDSHTFGKQILSSGGIVVHAEGYQFHINPGPGSLVQLSQAKLNPRETTALFVTNSSLVNSNDVNAVISAMTLNGSDKQGVLICSQDVVDGFNDIPILHNFSKDSLERVIVPSPGQKIGIQSIEIDALSTKSNNPNSLGFKIITPRHVLTLTGDTKYDDEIVSQYHDSDTIILNVLFPFGESGEGLSADDVVKIINKVNPLRVILTGFGRKILNANPIYVAREIQRQTSCEIVVAKLGLNINL